MTTTSFVTIEIGQKYALPITTVHGKDFRILVKKTQAPNPSVRGGAYMTRWVAYNGALNLREFGDTRQEAVGKAVAHLVQRGTLAG
jgi:hypothetical protein